MDWIEHKRLLYSVMLDHKVKQVNENSSDDTFSKSSNLILTNLFNIAPSTRNDYLTSIEAKKHRLALDRKLVDELNKKIQECLKNPSKIIR